MIESKTGQQTNSMLPVTEQFIQEALNRGLKPTGIGLFIIQHLLDDTECFIRTLGQFGFQIRKVIGIEYSSKSKVVERLREQDIDVILPQFSELEITVKHALKSELKKKSKESVFRFLIHEVGGYCAPFLGDHVDFLAEKCIGIVEETKQGLWRYRDIGFLPLPVMQIADSKLKGVEAKYVGEAVARAVESDLLELGVSLCNCCIGLLGFGDIGASIATSLRCRGTVVSCYDPNPLKVIDAKMQGFACPGREYVLKESKLIIGASGMNSVIYDDLSILRDNAMLVSVSSRDLEFPVKQITMASHRSTHLTRFVSEFTMPWGKRIRIANCGFPVNFRGPSLPLFVSDLLFCQIAACMMKLITQHLPPDIHCLSADEEKLIAKLWLECYA